MPAIRRFASLPFALVLLCVLPAFGADVLEKSKRVRVVFTSGYAQCLTLANAFASSDPARARRILERLVEAQPDRPAAAELLRRLFTP